MVIIWSSMPIHPSHQFMSHCCSAGKSPVTPSRHPRNVIPIPNPLLISSLAFVGKGMLLVSTVSRQHRPPIGLLTFIGSRLLQRAGKLATSSLLPISSLTFVGKCMLLISALSRWHYLPVGRRKSSVSRVGGVDSCQLTDIC